MLAEGDTPLNLAFRQTATQPQSAGGAPGGLPHGLVRFIGVADAPSTAAVGSSQMAFLPRGEHR